MRRMITAVAIMLMAAGCGLPQSGSSPSLAYAPLDAYIMTPGSQLAFHVSRPAYVAMFEIIPGLQTQLLYPSRGHGRMDGFVHAGDRVFQGSGFWGPDLHLARRGISDGRMTQPRFLFLIASDRPLRLEQFGPSGYGISNAMGYRNYAATSPYMAMERLAEMTLPSMVDDGSWTTDVFVYWPEVLHDRRGGREVIVSCNGYQMLVPFEYAREVRRQICGRQAARAPGDPADDDSTGIVQPGRRSPVPPEAGGGGDITSSRQLQELRRRGPEVRPAPGERIAVDPADDAGEDADGQSGRANPGNRGGRGQPATPATPADPGDRGQPATPATPADPGGRGQPATPADPGGRGQPATPATPADPGGRGQPATPAVPADPGGHAQPATPAPPRGRGKPTPRAEPSTPAPERERTPASPPSTPASTPASTPVVTPPPPPPSGERERPAPRGRGTEKCNPCQVS